MTSKRGTRLARIVALLSLWISAGALKAEAQILGTAADFGVLGGSTVTNTGSSVIQGNVGVSPGSAIVGFPPGIVVPPGTIHAADAVAAQAQVDVTTAYNALRALPAQFNLTGQNLGGLALGPAVYAFATSAQLTGVLTLNGQGNSAAQFVFQIGSTLTTASNSAVLLINGANGNNVYWTVGSSATLGTNSVFAGNILALTSITLNTGASLTCGRALAQNGAVTLDSNTITLCVPNGGGGGGGNDVPLNRLGGSGITGAQEAAFGASGLFGSALLDQAALWRQGAPQQPQNLGSLKDGPSPGISDAEWSAGYQPRGRRFWAIGFGGTGSLDGEIDNASSDLKTRTAGFAAGLDYQIDRTALVGIAGGYTNSTFSVNDDLTSGTADGGHIGLYGVKSFGQMYLAGALEYGHFENQTDRFIEFVVNERARGHFGSDMFGTRTELGLTRSYGLTNVTSFVGMNFSQLTSDGFTEHSDDVGGAPGILGLTFASHSATSLTSIAGVFVDRIFDLPNGRTLTPFARVAWVHEYFPDRSLDSFLTLSPAAAFSVEGAPAASDAANIDAGIRIGVNDSLALFAYLDSELSGRGQNYTGNGGLKISW